MANKSFIMKDQLTFIHDYFIRRTVYDHPQKVSLILEGQCLSYAEVFHASQHLADHLLSFGYVKNLGDIVCQCKERSIEMVIGIVAILMAGGVYCPLTPDEPPARLAALIEDSEPSCILVTENTADRVPKALCFDTTSIILQAFIGYKYPKTGPARSLNIFSQEARNAVVIFTSGSTGKPKGIQISHGNFISSMAGVEQEALLTANDTVLQRTPVTFDMHLQDVLGSLMLGACLVIIPPGADRDLEYIMNACSKFQISCLSTVPTVWSALIEYEPILDNKLSTLRILISSGEALQLTTASSLLAKMPAKARLINGYGPAECTLCSTIHTVTEEDTKVKSIPIGHAAPGHRVLICDDDLRPVPDGQIGELFVSGPAVFGAYLKRPDLTKIALIPIPDQTDGKFYRTGDLARLDPSSNLLYFIGRKDFQVKLRGQRIECQEIEHCLTSCPLDKPITLSVVVKVEHLGMEHLVAYVESDDEKIQHKLRSHCDKHLPQYMVPSLFMVCSRLPLNTNGKLDRKRLPEPDFSTAIIASQEGENFESPQTETEHSVLALWRDLLGISDASISTTASFFTLSGNSLHLMRLVRSYGIHFNLNNGNLLVAKFFPKPTISEHARLIDEHIRADSMKEIDQSAFLGRTEGPVTFSQMSIFADSQVRFFAKTDTALNNVPYIYKVQGVLCVDKLHAALDQVVFKQTVLRTSLNFDEQTGDLRQEVVDFDNGKCYTFVESSVETDEELFALFLNEKLDKTLLDTTIGLVFRCNVIHYKVTENFVCFNIHHAAADGESHLIFSRDLEMAYSHPSDKLEPLTFTYIDYAWEQLSSAKEMSKMEIDMRFWKTMFDGTTSTAFINALPYDKPPNSQRFGRGYTYNVNLPEGIAEKIHELARKSTATVTQVLVAGFYAFLFRLTQETDMHIGLPTVNRNGSSSLFDIVGSFVNVLPLRCQLDSTESFLALIAKTKAMIISSLTHTRPYMQILRQTHCAPMRIILEVEWTPWFERTIKLDQTALLVPHQEGDDALFDIFCCIDVSANGKRIGIKYNGATDVFDTKTIKHMAERFALALTELANSPEKQLSTLSILLPHEITLVRSTVAASTSEELSTTSQLKSKEITEEMNNFLLVHQRFVYQATEKHPQKVAVIFGEQSLSYDEILYHSYELSVKLMQRDYIEKIGDIACQCLEKSIETVIGIIATLMVGGVYCPISQEEPDSRIERFLQECQPSCIFVHHQTKHRFNPNGVNYKIVNIAELIHESCDENHSYVNQEHAFPMFENDAIAFVLFTSGSTGQPKGVCLSHRNFTAYVSGEQTENILTPNDIVLQRTPVTFSMHLQEIVGSLWVGATMVLVPNTLQRNITAILNMFSHHTITYAVLTSSLLTAIFKEVTDFNTFATIRAILTGGEPLKPATAARTLALLPINGKLIYSYGQTEAPLDIVHYEVFAADLVADTIPIGRNALPGYSVVLLDEYLQPTIPGRVGEICIRGEGVFCSYLNRPELTSAALVKVDCNCAQGIFYRTGDLGWINPSTGLFYYVGRKDFQVKLRGQRIECGEIEQVISSCTDLPVNRAVVVKRIHCETEHLVAYLELEDQVAMLISDEVSHQSSIEQNLRSHCEKHLPLYMVPSLFVLLQRLPLNANGKLDRKALPEPDFSRLAAGIEQINTIQAPHTETEFLVLAIWCDLLHIPAENFSTTSNLFSFGGNSLLLMHLVRLYETRLSKTLGSLSFADFFEKPTIRDHAHLLDTCST